MTRVMWAGRKACNVAIQEKDSYYEWKTKLIVTLSEAQELIGQLKDFVGEPTRV